MANLPVLRDVLCSDLPPAAGGGTRCCSVTGRNLALGLGAGHMSFPMITMTRFLQNGCKFGNRWLCNPAPVTPTELLWAVCGTKSQLKRYFGKFY